MYQPFLSFVSATIILNLSEPRRAISPWLLLGDAAGYLSADLDSDLPPKSGSMGGEQAHCHFSGASSQILAPAKPQTLLLLLSEQKDPML